MKYKFVRNTDYGTYWMEKQFDDNLTIMVEFFDERYDSKSTKKTMNKLYKEFKKHNYYGLIKPMMEYWIKYVEKHDGEFIDSHELCSEVYDVGNNLLFEGTSFEDAEEWCSSNEEDYYDL